MNARKRLTSLFLSALFVLSLLPALALPALALEYQEEISVTLRGISVEHADRLYGAKLKVHVISTEDDPFVPQADVSLPYLSGQIWICSEEPMVISGEATSSVTIIIKEDTDASLTLNGLDFSEGSNLSLHMRSGSNLTLTLADGTENYFSNDSQSSGGLTMPPGGTLRILGTGSLVAESGNYFSSAIGNTSDDDTDAMTIIIGEEGSPYGPTITATNERGVAIGDSSGKNGYDIQIHSGTVTALGGIIGIGGHITSDSTPPPERNILITGGTVFAGLGVDGLGSGVNGAAIGGNFSTEYTGAEGGRLTIKITGGDVKAFAGGGLNGSTTNMGASSGVGIGGLMSATDKRTIEITGGVVSATGAGSYPGIGGGDGGDGTDRSTGSEIIISGDAYISRAKSNARVSYGSPDDSAGIGGGSANSSWDAGRGGYIEISGNASVGIGSNGDYYTIRENPGASGIGGGLGYSTTELSRINGGDGGTILINTTGNVRSEGTIGGGNGARGWGADNTSGTGGSGGNITILNGEVTVTGSYNTGGNIGGGNGGRGDFTSGLTPGNGGDGGNILIAGGNIDTVSYLGAAGIGGGGGGSANTEEGSEQNAGIGGNGGNITITGGYIYVRTGSYTDGAKVPALIGGGARGGSGFINISGGTVRAYEIDNYNYRYSTANNMGHGESYDGIGDIYSITITGGNVQTGRLNGDSYYGDRATVSPTPTDGSDTLNKVWVMMQDTAGTFSSLSTGDLTLVSLEVGGVSYGTKDVVGFGDSFFLWLPLGTYTNAKATVRLGNTYYDMELAQLVNDPARAEARIFTEVKQYTSEISLSLDSARTTYNGAVQNPTVTVRDSSQTVLTPGSDYAIAYTYNRGTEVSPNWQTVSEIKAAGSYRVTATGAGTYAGMSDVRDFAVGTKYIEGSYTMPAITKEYDGTDRLPDGATVPISLTFAAGAVETGDTVTAVMTPSFYQDAGIGADKRLSYHIEKTGSGSENYYVDLATPLVGSITVKVIGPSNLAQGTLSITKPYDGNVGSTNATVTGSLSLVDLVGGEIATVSIVGWGDFDSAHAGTNKTVTVTLGELGGDDAGNYTLAGGATTFEASATILPADYSYTVATQQEFPEGTGLDYLNYPNTAQGVNGETVSGTVTVYSDETMTEEATDAFINQFAADDVVILYIEFVPHASETNYVQTAKSGEIEITILEGAPQDVSFDQLSIWKTYGDQTFINEATNDTPGGGTITYRSGDEAIAIVDAVTGEVTIVGAGTVLIYATAARIPGEYAATTVSYALTVEKKGITITVQDALRKYGEANPTFAFDFDSGDLVGSDSEDDLKITLSCTAGPASPAGVPVEITGSSASNKYDVTVIPGTLTILKADRPAVENLRKAVHFQIPTSVSISLTANLPADRGDTQLALGTVTGDAHIISSAAISGESLLVETLTGDDGEAAVIPITATMQNYEDVTFSVTVTLVDKELVTITGVVVQDKVYDGAAIAPTGTIDAGGYTGALVYSYIGTDGSGYRSNEAPRDAGAYQLTVSIPEDDEAYMGESDPIAFVITRAPLIVKPADQSITINAAIPALTVEYQSLKGSDTADVISGTIPEMKVYQADGVTELTSTATRGTYPIKFFSEATLTAANYDITLGDGTLTITTSGGGGSGGGGGGGGSSSSSDSNVTVSGGTATAKATVSTSESGGIASGSISQTKVKDAIGAAEKKAGEDNVKAALELDVEASDNANGIRLTIPAAAIKNVADSAVETMTVTSPVGSITLDEGAIASVSGAGTRGSVVVKIEEIDAKGTLNDRQKETVGDRPVYDISITNGATEVTDFGTGLVTISLPYELKEGENPSGIVVYYLDTQGNIQRMDTMYDTRTKCVMFTTNHLSLYVIAYEEVWTNPFSDVSRADWFYDDVAYVVSQGLFTGTGDTTFAPSGVMTRGMVVTVLWRMEDSPAPAGENLFTDLSQNWYVDAVAWANEKGIVTGYGGSLFGPEDNITREQFAAMLYRYAEHKGMDVSARGDLAAYADHNLISDWAAAEMRWALAQGLITGKTASTLAPSEYATRAQAATILSRLLNQ